MNRTALALSSLLCLAAPAAFAHGHGEGFRHGRHGEADERWDRDERRDRDERWEHREHAARQQGHWEQRVVPQWVPGRYETQVLPPSCAWYGGFQQCSPGVTQQVWREGAFVNTTTWVWVGDAW